MQATSVSSNPAVRFGLLAGLATAVLFILFYFLEKSWMLSPVLYYGSLLLFLGAMYLALRAETRQGEQKLGWRDALRSGFVVYLVANAVFWLVYFSLHQFDAELVEIQRDTMRRWYPSILPKDQLAEGLRELEKADLRLTARKALLGYARGAMAGFIWAAILATLYRRETIKF